MAITEVRQPLTSSPPPQERVLSVVGHLEELRRRLGLCLGAFLIASGIGVWQAPQLIEWLQRPADSWLPRLVFFHLTEPLVAYLKVGVLAGLAMTMPLLLWQVWLFVRPALAIDQRRFGRQFVWWASAQFLAGLAVAYYVLLPLSLRVLVGLGEALFEPVISVDAYLSFVTGLLGWCGLLLELPVVLVVLAKVGIVTPEWLRQQRPYAVLVLVIVAAVATPTTDPVSLCVMALPLLGLYELSIVMARWAIPPKPTHPRSES